MQKILPKKPPKALRISLLSVRGAEAGDEDIKGSQDYVFELRPQISIPANSINVQCELQGEAPPKKRVVLNKEARASPGMHAYVAGELMAGADADPLGVCGRSPLSREWTAAESNSISRMGGLESTSVC